MAVPTQSQDASAQQQPKSFKYGLCLCAAYILISAGLIDFNKYLMNRERFPYAMTLTFFHMFSSTVCATTLYLLKPSLYPAMQATEGKRMELLNWFLPLGLMFAVGLYASNQAYLYCSVAFLQFMKEGNVVLVFLLSCMVGLQLMSRIRFFTIVWIVGGATLAVVGEINFALIGFAFQLVSQFGECGKNVMGEYLLSGSNMRLDPLTYCLFMAPVCMCVLIVGNYFTWTPEIIPAVLNWYHLLIPNAMLAFCLNVCIAMLIKECSAMGFILSGLVKDMFIVSASAYLFNEVVATQQVIGFAICLAGIFFWSYCKMFPESEVVQAINSLLGARKEISAKEQLPLVSKDAEKGRA